MNSEDLNIKIKDILNKSGMAFEEVRAFFDGLQYLSDLEKQEFITITESQPHLIYPLYINFKAKLKALDEDNQEEWDKIIEGQIEELERYIHSKGIPEN